MIITSRKTITNSYGFIAYPSLSKYTNIVNLLSQMDSTVYFNIMRITSYRNLCTTIEPPDGISYLLGLGMKLCMQERYPPIKPINEGYTRFRQDVRLKYLFARAEEDSTVKDNNKLYIKSEWMPPISDNNLKNE